MLALTNVLCKYALIIKLTIIFIALFSSILDWSVFLLFPYVILELHFWAKEESFLICVVQNINLMRLNL